MNSKVVLAISDEQAQQELDKIIADTLALPIRVIQAEARKQAGVKKYHRLERNKSPWRKPQKVK